MPKPKTIGRVVEEFLRMKGVANGPVPRTENTGTSSTCQKLDVKYIQSPTGERSYPQLGIHRGAEEDLLTAINRAKRAKLKEIFNEALIPRRFAEWTWETFPREAGKAEALAICQEYAKEQRDNNLVIIGPKGSGKTGLAVCVLRERLLSGVPSLFLQVPDMLDRIRATYEGYNKYDDVMESLKAVDFLVMDDLGAYHVTDWTREKMFQILGYRHDWMMPVVVTSDRNLSQIGKITGERTLARLIEGATIAQVGGRDLRS